MLTARAVSVDCQEPVWLSKEALYGAQVVLYDAQVALYDAKVAVCLLSCNPFPRNTFHAFTGI